MDESAEDSKEIPTEERYKELLAEADPEAYEAQEVAEEFLGIVGGVKKIDEFEKERLRVAKEVRGGNFKPLAEAYFQDAQMEGAKAKAIEKSLEDGNDKLKVLREGAYRKRIEKHLKERQDFINKAAALLSHG